MDKKTRFAGLFFCITAAVIWGFAFVAQTTGSDHITPFYFNGTRFLLGAVALLPVALIFERTERDNPAKLKKTVICGSVTGVLLFLASYFQQLGIDITRSPGKAGFITGLYMVIVPIIGVFMKKRTPLRCWIGALLGAVGLFLICTNGGRIVFTLGDLVLIAAAVVFAFHIISIDSFGDHVYSLRFTVVQFVSCAVINLVCAFIFEEPSLIQIKDAAIPILYCGILSSGVGYTFQVLGQKRSDPTSASIIFSTESVFSAIGGALILREVMHTEAYIGCALIFAGIIISQVQFNIRKKKG